MRTTPFALLTALTLAPTAPAQDMVALSQDGLTYAVDSANGAATLIGWSGIAPPGCCFSAMAITDSGRAYATGQAGLLGLDLRTGEVTSTFALPAFDFLGLAWEESSATLLALRLADDGLDTELWRIEPGVSAMSLGSTGLRGLAGLDVAPDGTVYSYDVFALGLVALDPMSGAVSDVFPSVGTQGSGDWVAVSPDGSVYVGADDIRRVDLMSGAEQLIGEIPASVVRGLDFLPDGAASWPERAFCFGDGSGAACPCGNESSTLSGCKSWDPAPSGGTLASTGSTSVAADDLRLGALGLVWFASPVVFFQGSAPAAGGRGLPFGDGLLCTNTELVRLETVMPSVFASANTSVSIAAAGGVSAGDTRYYQLWYRSGGSQPSLCGSGFNLTNALEISWTP